MNNLVGDVEANATDLYLTLIRRSQKKDAQSTPLKKRNGSCAAHSDFEKASEFSHGCVHQK